MNISNNTLDNLGQLYTYTLYDNNWREVNKDNATKLHIGFERGNEFSNYINKTIISTKKELTLECIFNKINQQNTYQNFCDNFKKLVNSDRFNIYPTSYGIGIFVLLSFRNESEKNKQLVESVLNKYNIDYKTEYSDAAWVYRYKISKSKENIEKINNI